MLCIYLIYFGTLQYDLALAHLMDTGSNYVAVAFAMQLVQLYLVDDRNNIYANESDLYHTTESLVRMMSHSHNPPPEGLAPLIEAIRINQDPSTYLGERSPIGPTSHIHTGIMQVRVSIICQNFLSFEHDKFNQID